MDLFHMNFIYKFYLQKNL